MRRQSRHRLSAPVRDSVENGWLRPLELVEHSHAAWRPPTPRAASVPFGVLRGYEGPVVLMTAGWERAAAPVGPWAAVVRKPCALAALLRAVAKALGIR